MSRLNCIWLAMLLAALLCSCRAMATGESETLAVLVNLTKSAQVNPRLPRWKLERALDRIAQLAKRRGWDLEVIVVGGRDELSRHYGVKELPSGSGMLAELESLRLVQLEQALKLAPPPKGEDSTEPAAAVLHFGEYTDHGAALGLVRKLVPESFLAGVVIFTDGFDEDVDGSTGRGSFKDLESALQAFCADRTAPILVFGPGPEIPEPADGRQMVLVWRELLEQACSQLSSPKGDSQAFLVMSDFLDCKASVFQISKGASHGS